MKIQQTGRE